ncbi:MAG: Holliday junction branch migration protein RuvA [Bryobacteraceae bacterium]|nr:Holliday junction branch migration protein RuvA [Bryobacteraceae bacterium]
MIAHLRGTLLEKHPNQVIVECGGVGYDVTIPVTTFTRLPELGQEVKLRIHTQVREDAFALFGFASVDEKLLFEKLIGVSGIGPKLAVTVLSGLAAVDLVTALRQGDLARLVKIPGVGKKTAERMVLELRDKVDGLGAGGPAVPVVPRGPVFTALEEDILSALGNLGCARPNAETALRKAQAAGVGDDFEVLFRKALELVR